MELSCSTTTTFAYNFHSETFTFKYYQMPSLITFTVRHYYFDGNLFQRYYYFPNTANIMYCLESHHIFVQQHKSHHLFCRFVGGGRFFARGLQFGQTSAISQAIATAFLAFVSVCLTGRMTYTQQTGSWLTGSSVQCSDVAQTPQRLTPYTRLYWLEGPTVSGSTLYYTLNDLCYL